MYPTPKSRSHTVRYAFNTIEVILALVIVAVGIIGLLGLYPTSQEATRNAISRSSAADSADQFMRYYASKLKVNWSMASTLPIAKPGTDESGVSWSNSDAGGMMSDISGVVLYYNDMDNDGTFDYLADETTAERDDSGLFRIVSMTDTNVQDFDAVMRVWRTPATYKSYDASVGTWFMKPVPPDNGATVNVEVSYPSSVPYEQREKQTFMMDVFRPVAVASADPAGAFTIPTSGTLQITYHGSNAGWRNVQSFWFVYPETDETTPTGHAEEKIFASATTSDQNTVFERSFSGGSSFNCFISTNKTVGGKPAPFRHYAWADEEEDAFYFDSTTSNDGFRHHNSGKPYCIVVEQVPGRKWFFGFEDIPGDSGPDWDYEDCMVTVELFEDGSSANLFGSVVGANVTTQSSTPIKLSQSNGWDCVIVKASDGKAVSTDLGGGSFYPYNGRVTCVWFRPKGTGTQQLMVDGSLESFDNSDLVAISDLNETMEVNVYKEGSEWYMTVNAPNCVYTTIK